VNQIKLWKKCVLVLTFGALVAGGTIGLLNKNIEPEQEVVVEQQPTAVWQVYQSSDQRFAVHFPTEPVENDQQMVIQGKNVSYQELSAALNDSTYSVSYIDFPGHWKWIGSSKLLTKGFDAFVQSEQNVEALLKQQITTFNGLPALEYRLKQAGKEIEGKFVIAGNTLYRITVAYPLAVAENAQPENFFDSFQINS
jgi:hypothetical protein